MKNSRGASPIITSPTLTFALVFLVALGLILSGSVSADEPVTMDQMIRAFARANDRAKETGKPVQIEPEDSIDPVTPPVVPQVNPYSGYDTSRKVSEPSLTLIPEDPIAAKLKFSDKTISYKKVFYLKGARLGFFEWWIDENRYVTENHADYKEMETLPKIVIVDVRTGEMEDTGYQGKIDCYSEGRLATTNITLSRNPDGKVVRHEARYFGKLGEPLTEYQPYFGQANWEQDKVNLNIMSCQLVPHWIPPKPQAGEPRFVERFPLKVEHGAIMVWKPQDYPELRLGQDPNNYNKLTFNRTGSAVMLPLRAYWEQPSGKRVDIPLNPGEEISSVSWIPFEQAYLISIDLTNTQPIKTWYPRFARLLYPDGTIKRFGVPRVIMDLLRTQNASSGAIYGKPGMSWGVGFNTNAPDKHLAGGYVVIGGELVQETQLGSLNFFDGCKEYSSEEALFSKKRNYFYIDICKGE